MTDFSLARPFDHRRRGLFGSLADFLCLGGGAFLALLVVALLPGDTVAAPLATVMLVVANFVNHPHFAHSYQIFYRGFSRRLRDPGVPARLRLRYAFAGIMVPLLLAGYFVAVILLRDPAGLGYALNFMGFVVGWHYVKQGFGIAMVDASFAGRFYAAATRRAMLANGYACWIYAWVESNRALASRDLWGIETGSFAFGAPVAYAVGAVFALTSAWLLVCLVGDYRRHGRGFAVNGLVAYLVTLYAWVAFARLDPLFVYVIPAMHSLQYLAVVWRFEINRVGDRTGNGAEGAGSARSRLAAFGIFGLVLGAAGFWILPLALDRSVSYDHALFGPNLFLFTFWIFINVHHYFIDNVIWRRENPEARRYLFA